jgi:hypothetical protein
MTIDEEREFLARWEAKATVRGVLTVLTFESRYAMTNPFVVQVQEISPGESQ